MAIRDDNASDTAQTAGSTGWDFPTPSHTVVSDGDEEEDDANNDRKPDYKKPDYGMYTSTATETVPQHGNTYVIRARDSGRAITLVNKELQLREWDCAGDKSSHWECEESSGWIAFKNPVGGKYIGHNGNGVLHAQAEWHLLWEGFCPRKHPDGGFLLLNRGWWWWNPLQHVDVDQSGQRLVHNSSKGTVWEFVKL